MGSMIDPQNVSPSASNRQEDRTWVKPSVKTYSPEELLDLLGPAQGYNGTTNPGRGGWFPGRGHRLFPGLR